jgi:signal transduction histidine kinase
MRSFHGRMALWFTLSVLAVTGSFVLVTYLHLDYELRQERWEREHPEHADWTLHGSYSEAEVQDIMGELARLSLVYAVPLMGLALAIGFYFARQSTRPVAAINAQLQDIGARNLHQRLSLPTADREFVAIQQHINQLLERLELSFHQLDEFSARVAHDLRTPLTLMRLQVEEAAGKIEPVLAESLQDELKRLSDHVDRCLLLARAEQGNVALNLENVDLGRLLREMIEVYELLAREEHRTIEIRGDRGCIVRADSGHLRQMLHNLLTNALKHGEGLVRIDLRCGPGGALCRIENQMAHRESANPAGLGLGLRIVKALAALHPALSFRSGQDGAVYWAELRSPDDASAAAPEAPGLVQSGT